MATVSFPTFSVKEILTAEKLNSWVTSLEDKFTAGFDASDLQWPLLAAGDINMGKGSSGYSILQGKKFMNIVHAGGYDSLSDAVTAAGSGGVVLIPPDTTITSGGGITFVGSNVAVIGCGPSSVIKFTSSPTAGYMFRNDTGGISGIRLANLTLDGNSGAGSGQAGMIVRGASDVSIVNVIFDDFSGIALQITDDGTNKAQRVLVSGCTFKTGDDHHIQASNVLDLHIVDSKFRSCPQRAVELVAGGNTEYISRVAITNSVFSVCSKESIYIAGSSGSVIEFQGDVTIRDCMFQGQVAEDVILAGHATGVLTRVLISGCRYTGGTGPPADGISMLAYDGIISDCDFHDATGDGIDLGASYRVSVHDNMLRDAGAYGILTASTSDCRIVDNDLGGATTYGVELGGTNLRMYGNRGQLGSVPNNIIHAATYSTSMGSTVESNLATFSVRAYQLEIGDMIDFSIRSTKINANGVAYVYLRLNSTTGPYIGRLTYNTEGSLIGVLKVRVHVTSDSVLAGWYGAMHSDSDQQSAGGSGSVAFDRTSAITFVVTGDCDNALDYVTLGWVDATIIGHKDQ